MYKLIRRILSGRKLIGYLITDGTCVKQINLSEAKGLSQDGLLSKVSYDQRNDRLVGKGIDLRSLGTVQISELTKDKLENNKVNYKIIKSGTYIGETVGLIRVKDTANIQIKNVQCDQLIIYSTETAVSCPHIDIDYRTVKVKNLVLVNINESLFDMLYPYGGKQFIDMLNSINYIKSDGFQTIHTGKRLDLKRLDLKSLDFRYKLTNTNWYKGITSEIGFIYDYREFISENNLDLTAYMNKLYNDKVVRQIVNGEILLELDRYMSNTNTQAIREHLNFQKFEKQLRLRGLYGKDKLKGSGIDDDFQLMAFRLDNYTVGDSEQFPDALIDIDLETVNKLIENCTDFQTLRKLIFPNTQVFRIIGKGNKVYDWLELRQYTLKYTENLSSLYKKQYDDRKCSVVTNSQTAETLTKRVTMNNSLAKCNEYKQIIDIPYISELLYPLESKLRLLNLGDSGKVLDDKQQKRTQELVQSKILRYLLDLYRQNRNLEQYMSSILIELLCKYCRADDILIDDKICVNYRGKVGYSSSTSIDNSMLNVKDYDIELDSIDALIETPDLSVFITDADMLLALGIKSKTGDYTITQAGRKIEQFDLGNYNFVNLRSLNNMFSGARLKKLILDGKQFNSQRIRSIDGMLSNAKIDEVIIKNVDFRQVKNCYGFMLAFNGKLIILNQLLNDHMLGYIESFRSQIILSKINESVKRLEFITDDPSIRYCRLNETKLVSDGHTNKIVWKSYNQSLLDYGDSTRKQRDDYIKLNKS